MTKAKADAQPEQELQTFFVPLLGGSVEAVDLEDLNKKVKKALEAEEGDANS